MNCGHGILYWYWTGVGSPYGCTVCDAEAVKAQAEATDTDSVSTEPASESDKS